jgi:hypothetical protein
MPSKASMERRNWVASQGEQKHNRSLGQNGNPLLEQGESPYNHIWMYRTGPGDAFAGCRPERRSNLSLNCA